jgi:hypothetical protein
LRDNNSTHIFRLPLTGLPGGPGGPGTGMYLVLLSTSLRVTGPGGPGGPGGPISPIPGEPLSPFSPLDWNIKMQHVQSFCL